MKTKMTRNNMKAQWMFDTILKHRAKKTIPDMVYALYSRLNAEQKNKFTQN